MWENSSKATATGVALCDKFFVWVIVSKDWSLGYKEFYFTEGLLLAMFPMPFNSCLSQSSNRFHDMGMSWKKFGKVVDCAIESLNVLLGLWRW